MEESRTQARKKILLAGCGGKEKKGSILGRGMRELQGGLQVDRKETGMGCSLKGKQVQVGMSILLG